MRKTLRLEWIFGVVLVALIAGFNLLFPLPISNDFPGLGMSCFLMEKFGIRYAINSNWGFAHTALCYALSQITGDLQVAQRLLTGIFSLISIGLIYRIAFDHLKAPKDAISFLALGLLAGSYFYLDLSLSPHMDIIPITLLLWVIFRSHKTTGSQLLLSGAILGMTYWFRFHFLLPALAFPFWALFYFKELRLQRAGWLLAGVLPAVAVPFVLTRMAFGKWSVSNQKALLGEMIYGENWDCDFQYALQHIEWQRLGADFELLKSFRRFAADFTYHTEMSVIGVILLTYLFVEGFFIHKKQDERSRQTAWMLFFLTVCILPLLFIRTATTRLMAMLMLPAFPFLLAIVRQQPRVYAALVVVLGLTFLWRNASQVMIFRERQQKMRCDIALLEKHAGKALMRNHPERIYASEEFFNPHSKYCLLSPVLTHAWPCRYEPFREKFGVVRPRDLVAPGQSRTFDYLIFTHQPENPLFLFPREELLQRYELVETIDSGTSVWRNKLISQ